MWRRFKRMVEANLGRLRDDPLGARPGRPADLRALTEQLATVRSQVALLERDTARLAAEEAALGERIKAALANGERDAALRHAEQLKQVREDRARAERQLEAARRVCAQAEGLTRGAANAATGPVRSPDVEMAAEETLRRLERDLLGDGPASASKTVGAAPAREADEVSSKGGAVKTIGGGGEPPLEHAPEQRPARHAKTIGDLSPEVASPKVESAASEPTGADLVVELERLARLREQGVLTSEEFDQAKRRLLARG